MKKTYKIVQKRRVVGWTLRRAELCGLSARMANKIVAQEREHENSYAPWCRPARLLVVCEQTGVRMFSV